MSSHNRGGFFIAPHGSSLHPTIREIIDGGSRLALMPPTRPAEPQPASVSSSKYGAAYNSTSATPTNPLEGVALPWGRVWAEARSMTNAAGGGFFEVTLISSQNGVRAIIESFDTTGAASNVAGGSVRFWVWEPLQQVWALGTVEETLATGASRVCTSDQFVTVGSK